MFPVKFGIQDRGATPRGMARRMNGMKKQSWVDTATLFHVEMRDNRFTHAHARAAGYTPRKRKYEQRKRKKFKHTYPLQWSGDTRKAVRAAAISTQSKGARVAYAGARVFNFRNPKSNVNMAVEFTTVTQREADQLANRYDTTLDGLLRADSQENQ